MTALANAAFGERVAMRMKDYAAHYETGTKLMA